MWRTLLCQGVSLSFSFHLITLLVHLLSESLAPLVLPLTLSFSLGNWQYLLMSRLKRRERAHSVIPRQWPTGRGNLVGIWVIAYRSRVSDKTFWMIRHRKWSWHSEEVRLTGSARLCWEMESIRGPLQCFICFDLFHKGVWKVSSLWVPLAKDKEEAGKVEMLKCVCMIAEEWLIFGVSHLVPTSVALLEEESRSWR